MARTPPRTERQRKTGDAAGRGPAATGTAMLAVHEAIATEEGLALTQMPTERTGEAQAMAGNTRPRPLLGNGRDIRASAREIAAPADREMRFATSEGSAIAGLLDREEAFVQTHRRLQGQIDAVDWAAVNGWVWDPKRPGERIRLELVDGETPLLTTLASDHRPELVSRGIGDGGYGFSIEFPSEILAEGRHTLHLRCADSGAIVPGSPIVLDYTGVPQTPRAMTGMAVSPAARPLPHSAPLAGTRILFDISDLVYYIGHHANLTGIQRVQSSIVLAVLTDGLLPQSDLVFLSFNARSGNWVEIPTAFLFALLQSLFLPEGRRAVHFPAEEARIGLLPGAREFTGIGVLDNGKRSVLCLLGAAWVNQDYIYRVLALKRQFGTRFVMTVHDLIPIYASETCDQDTVRVFEEFMRRALRHVDHVLSVSENTSNDVKRYTRALQIAEPPITVTKNGSSFAEFLANGGQAGPTSLTELPERFVLFVATIEGRKNHRLMLDIWRRMIEDGDDPPHLICIGRLGWKSNAFISALVETGYLGGRIHLLRDICDADLRLLYSRCLFTLCPSFYEGWGLPVGESLAMGKICVSSDRASLPEVAGDFGVYIDIDDFQQSLAMVRELIDDKPGRDRLEAKIRRGYQPVTWRSVAERVISACQTAVRTEWRKPYPYATIPYSSEISFGRLDRDIDGVGDALLARIEGSRRGEILLDPLQEQSFLWGEELRSRGYWASPENWGTWACRSGGEIALGLGPNESLLYYVFLRLRVSGPLADQPMRLSANGVNLWNGTIGPGSRNIGLRVRKPAASDGGWRLRIGAQIELSEETRERIAAFDSRIPTIGFERLIVVPENDLKTRLEILYALLV
jgi:glycosyltransferase involved in cell wall biosynthesis